MIIRGRGNPLGDLLQRWRRGTSPADDSVETSLENATLIVESEEPLPIWEPPTEEYKSDAPQNTTDSFILDRNQIVAQVRKYAESHLEFNRKKESKHPIIQLVHLPARLLHLFTDTMSQISREFSGWFLAIPALTITGVILVVKPLLHEPAQNHLLIKWSATLPPQLHEHSAELLNTVQPEFTIPLWSSEIKSAAAASFQLGQILADIELAIASDNKKRLSLLLNRADAMASKFGLPQLRSQYDITQKADALTSLVTAELKDNSELSVLTNLGYWLETTRFSLSIIEQDSGSDALASQFRSISTALARIENAVKRYPEPHQEFTTLFSPAVIDLRHPEGRAAFSLQLNKTIAAFRSI